MTAPLAAPITCLFGRERELEVLARLVERERVVTVLGPGGTGKTRLVEELAAVVAADAPDGVTMLYLAPVRDLAEIAHALADALGIRVTGSTGPEEASLAYLAERSHLLVLDNCEHVADGARGLVEEIVRHCPEVTVLATSRSPLGLPVEQSYRLGPLELPAEDAGTGNGASPSVALFVDRARHVDPEFTLDEETRPAVERICRRLDGLPLAIELAAGRLEALGVDALAVRLDRSLDLLGDASGGERHGTLRLVVDWSYDLLGEDERALFGALSIFPGGFTLETAEQIGAATGLHCDPATALARLVNASMVVREAKGRVLRYRMLETIRSYGCELIATSGDEDDAFARLLDWAVGFVRDVERGAASTDEAWWDQRFRDELPNVRRARHWALEHDDFEFAAAITTSLHEYMDWRELGELRAWALELTEHPAIADSPSRASVLAAAARSALRNGDLDKSERLARAGFEGASDGESIGRCRALLALNRFFRGDYKGGVRLGLKAAERPQARGIEIIYVSLAVAYQGDVEGALALVDKGEARFGEDPPPSHVAWADYTRGEILGADDPERAEAHLTRAIDLARETRPTFVEGVASVALVSLWHRSKRTERAVDGYRSLIELWTRTGSWLQQWTTLRNVARLLAELDDPESSALLLAAADRAPDASAVTGEDGERLDRLRRDLLERLGDERCAQVEARTAAAPRSEIAEEALLALERASNRARSAQRVLATVLMTDIVGSTATAAELGDRRWREVIEAHDRVMVDVVTRNGGRVVRSTGDGCQALFEMPAAAIRAASEAAAEIPRLGVAIRAGLHTGETEIVGDELAGLAVHLAARVMDVGGSDEVVVSGTVRDLVLGSELVFDDRGEYELKGIPGSWHLWTLAPGRRDPSEATS